MRTSDRDRGQRIVTGIAPGSGPGWTGTKIATGQIQLRFSPPFKSIPVVTAIPLGAGNIAVAGANSTADSTQLFTYAASTGAAGDWTLGFTAVGVPVA